MNTKQQQQQQQQQPATLLPSYETLMAQAQVFASAWASAQPARAGGTIQGKIMDKKQTEALRIATESLPMLKIAASLGDETGQISFHSSHLLNLIEGYNAARQEIASLTAQHYDQQAMGLCHVCGWKGVIDYPDGPVCVACEHDKTLSPQPAAQAAPVDAAVQQDAERWRTARSLEHCNAIWCAIGGGEAAGNLDATVDKIIAARAAQKDTND